MTGSFFHRTTAIVAVLVFLAPATAPAQNVGKISGAVKDAGTGEPLIGCNVSVAGTTLGGSTDPDGVFFILNVPPGKYDLQASMVGFQKVLQRDVIVNSGKTTVANFKLTSTMFAQQDVIVQAIRPDVEREKTSTSAIFRSDDVQSTAGIRDVGDVLALAADVTDGHFRGGRSGEEYYTLQGMGITNPLDNSSAFLPIMSAVEEVEVITSGFGAQYGNAQSGVVNITMKEGKSDRWRTRAEVRTRAPGLKHHGPGVFDPVANPYLSALLGDALWLQGDPSASSQTPYYTNFFPIDSYRRDTVVQLAVARALWQRQMHRDINRSYGRDLDYSLEAATGGPIDDNMRMFLALRSDIQWPVFPTEQPDVQRQVMGNIATDLGGGATLRLSGGFTLENTNVFPSSNDLGYLQWMWDRILDINYRKTTNLQLGSRFTLTTSPSTYYEVKLSSLWTRRQQGSTPSPDAVPDSLISIIANQISWDKKVSQVVVGPDKFYYLRGTDDFTDQSTGTVSLDASFTSQVTKSHLINGGMQVNMYNIDVQNRSNVRTGTGGALEIYKVSPFEAALFIQDKMEFEGLIANAGLRWDFWNPNANYYTNLFAPAVAGQEKAPMLARLQPRVGVSFPVSEGTVFHLNYGAFLQRPSFQYLLRKVFLQGSEIPQTLGNPRLEPEATNSYDIGVTQALGDGFTLDVSGYYKDVKNLIDQATFTSGRTGATYTSWFNRDYADIRGFRVALTRRRGALTGSINYQFSVATGKSATTAYAPVAFVQDTLGGVTTKLNKVPVRDILLSFDRTHNLILNLGYATGAEWGPFSDITISTNSFFRSGRPYTSPSNPKLINGARTPAEYNTNVKLTRTFQNFFGVRATLYVEVFNLLDQKILNYDYVFSVQDAGSTNNIVTNYEKYPIDDPVNGIRYYQDLIVRPAWAAADQSFLIYENAPRAFTFGFTMEL